MTEMTDELLADANERMGKSVDATQNEFGTVRTGRASPQILDRVVVDSQSVRALRGARTPAPALSIGRRRAANATC